MDSGSHNKPISSTFPVTKREETLEQPTMESAKHPKNSTDIPFELITEILSRVPAKNLIRFIFVTKQWLSLLQDPVFTHLHLGRSKQQDVRKLIKVFGSDSISTEDRRCKSMICSIDKYGVASPIHPKPYNLETFSLPSCNGLLCYITPESEVQVSNPITGETITLPKPSFLQKRTKQLFEYNTVIAIGFDSRSKVYKIVGWDTNYDSEVEIFTLGTNSWRKITGPGEGSTSRYFETVYVDGVSYWQRQISHANFSHRNELFSFDHVEEKFKTIQFPYDVTSNLKIENCCCLCESRGKFCVVDKQEKNWGEQKICVITLWLMNKYEDGRLEWSCQPPINVPSNGIEIIWRPVDIGNGEIMLARSLEECFLDSYNEQGHAVNSIQLDKFEGGGYITFMQFDMGSLVRLN